MKQQVNTPYVKKFDADGNLLNPITVGSPYISSEPNRTSRRAVLNPQREINNRKTHHLRILKDPFTKKIIKLQPRVQEIFNRFGQRIKRIIHY